MFHFLKKESVKLSPFIKKSSLYFSNFNKELAIVKNSLNINSQGKLIVKFFNCLNYKFNIC